jgi:hypothetical protein
VRRIELRLAENDPLLAELGQEAQLRGIELTQHIHDLLRSRYLIRHGQSLHDLLWLPGATTAAAPNGEPMPTPDTPSRSAARASASAWSAMLDAEE